MNILRHLAKAGVSVPALYHYDQTAGLLYLEDFGDLTLMEACQQASAADLSARYKQAIDDLVRIHSRATAPADPGCIAFHRSFDPALLLWEFEHFLEYGVVARNGRPMCADDYPIVQAEFRRIAEFMAGQPRVFTHRDYHSRNLMHIADGANPGIIDFQDAVYGPLTYDLASLFKDAYIHWEEDFTLDLLARYWEAARKLGLPVRADFADFHRDYEWMGVQRHIKVLGIFARLAHRDGKDGYLADMPLVMDYLRRACKRYRDLKPLLRLLDRLDPEPVEVGYTF